MTQNKSGVSTLLLRYQVAGQDQLLKANTAVAMSFKDTERAAKELGISMAKLQEMSNATISPSAIQSGLLGRVQSGQSAIDGFMRDLERIQAAEAKSVQNNQKITDELRTQAEIIQRRATGIRDIGMQRIPEPSLGDFGVRDTRSVRGTLTGVREGLIALPNVGYQNPAVVALRGLIPLVDKTGASFGQLGAALGIAGAALIGVAIAFDRFNRELEGSKRLLEGALAAQRNYYQALSDFTTEDADNRIAELQRVRPLLEQQAEENRRALEDSFRGAQQTILGDVGARVLFNQLPTGALKEALDQAEAALQENIQTETRLTQGREAGAFAANDARQAEEELADARKEALSQLVQDTIGAFEDEKQMRLQLAGLRRSGSSQQVQDQLAGNDDEIALLRNYLIPQTEVLASLGDETAIKQLQEYKDSLQDLYQENRLLLNQVLPVIQAREAETKALQDQLAAIQSGISYYAELSSQIRTATVDQVAERLNAIEDERRAIAEFLPQLVQLAPTSVEAAQALKEAQDSLTSLSLEYNDQITRVLPAALSRARAELSADLAKLESDRNAKFADIEATRLEKEAEAADKRGEAYTAAEEKRGDALNDLAEKQAEQRQRIEKKSNAEIANAIFARDALAAYLAMQQKQEQLDDLKADGEKRQREIDKQYEKERQQANRNYEKSLQQAQQAADKARNAARRQYDVEYNERVSAYNQQLALLRNFVSQANAALSNLTVPSLSSGLVNGTSGGTSNPPALPNSPYGVPPVNPQIGDTWTDAFGQLRVWNGNGWQAASAVRGYATGGVAQGLARINDGGGVESGMYNSNQLALFTKPTRIFSAQDTQRLFGGGGSSVNVNLNFDGKTIRATSRAQALTVLGEYLEDAGVD